MEQQNPILGQQQDQQYDWVQQRLYYDLDDHQLEGIRQNRRFRVPISERTSSLIQSQSFCQWTISLNKLQPLQKIESGLNQDKKLSTKSQFFQGESKQAKRIKQDFDNNVNKYLESIPQQQQLFRYHKTKQVTNQNQKQKPHFQQLFKRTFSIKEVIDNNNSQTVKILQINQMKLLKGKDNFNSDVFKCVLLIIKRRNILLNEKSKVKYLDLSKTNVDIQLLILITNNLQQLQSLNIQKCKLLSYLQLSGLSQLKHINVSGTPIKIVKLSQLQNLQSLTAQMCDQLSEITFDKCPKVVKINAFSCSSLVSLNSQHLKQLKYLQLDYCKRFIWKFIQNCKKLNYFSAKDSNISSQTANIILQNNKKLRELNLSYCRQINDKLHLKNNKKISNLKIFGGYFSQLQINSLNTLEELKLFYLSNLNKLIVKQCKNLRKLQFCQLDCDYIQFQDNPSIQQIQFSNFFKKGSEQFLMRFNNMPQKIKIYFYHCHVSHQLINQLQQLVKNHPKIQIFCQYNKFMSEDFHLSQSFSKLSLNNKMDIEQKFI